MPNSPFYEDEHNKVGDRPTLGDQMPPRYTVRQTAVNVADLESAYDDLSVVLQLLQQRDVDDAEKLVEEVRDRIYRYLP